MLHMPVPANKMEPMLKSKDIVTGLNAHGMRMECAH